MSRLHSWIQKQIRIHQSFIFDYLHLSSMFLISIAFIMSLSWMLGLSNPEPQITALVLVSGFITFYVEPILDESRTRQKYYYVLGFEFIRYKAALTRLTQMEFEDHHRDWATFHMDTSSLDHVIGSGHFLGSKYVSFHAEMLMFKDEVAVINRCLSALNDWEFSFARDPVLGKNGLSNVRSLAEELLTELSKLKDSAQKLHPYPELRQQVKQT